MAYQRFVVDDSLQKGQNKSPKIADKEYTHNYNQDKRSFSTFFLQFATIGQSEIEI